MRNYPAQTWHGSFILCVLLSVNLVALASCNGASTGGAEQPRAGCQLGGPQPRRSISPI
jgi:hypothetical protein